MTEKQLSEGSTDNERLVVTQVSADDEVYRVENRSHEDPSEHTYQVFLQLGDPVYCECPHHQHRDAECKHMQAVEDKLESRQEWIDWQACQKQKDEQERKQAILQLEERSQQEQAVIDSARSLIEEWDALAEAKETRDEMMTKDKWREMSSEGRRRAVAFL